MKGLATIESKPTSLYTGRFQDKHSISVEIDPPYSQHFQYEALLQKTIANLKIEAHTINQGSYKKFIQNHFFKNELDTAQNNKQKLHSIFSEIENLLYDSDISIENKIKNLESIAADIRTSILEIHIEKRSDQGKLEDVLTAFTTMNTNLWKALIDSKIINTAHFLHTCIPFFTSFLPLSLRTGEYIYIQFYDIKIGDINKVVDIYKKLLEGIDATLKILHTQSLHDELNKSKGPKTTNNMRPYKNNDSFRDFFIHTLQENSELRQDILKEFTSEKNNAMAHSSYNTPTSGCSKSYASSIQSEKYEYLPEDGFA